MKEIISTRNLILLPDINRVKQLCQSVAVLDAIIEPEWEYRYYSYNSKWDVDQEMASMRNGGQNSYFILFKPVGAIMKGFVPSSLMGEYAKMHGHGWPCIFDNVPSEFSDFLSEPAFSLEDTSFCIWRKYSDECWRISDISFPALEVDNINYPKNEDPDGSARLLSILDGDPRTYQKWSEQYYEVSVDLGCVESIYKHNPLSDEIVTKLNPKLTFEDVKDDITEIGYSSK